MKMDRKGMKINICLGAVSVMLCVVFCLILFRSERVYAYSDYSKTYSFTFEATVQGNGGREMEDTVYTISFNNGISLKKTMVQDLNITDWFEGETSVLVPGVKVAVAEDAPAGSTKLKIKFTGTAYGYSQDNISMRVRNTYFDNDETDLYAWANVSFKGNKPKFNIIKATFSQPSGTGAVATGLYFKNADGLSGNSSSGWKLTGEKGKAITAPNELTVYIDGYILTDLQKNKDISSWFSGETWGHNTLLGITTTSFLPEGVTAKLKNAVSVGDNSFTIVFGGTPEKGSRDFIAFTIPRGVVSHSGGYGTVASTIDPFRVTNTTGKYAYDISTDDYTDYYKECIRITYPNMELPAGTTLTEEDMVLAEYEIVGYSGSGTPLKFKGIKVGDNLKSLTYYEQYQYGGSWHFRPTDCVATSTGLNATVYKISDDWTKFWVRLTGTVAKPAASYPFAVGTYPFTLEVSYSTAGHYVSGIAANEGEFVIVQPDPHISMSAPVNITSTQPWIIPTVDNSEVVITLGDDTLAKDLSVGTKLNVTAKISENPQNHAIIISAVESSLFSMTVTKAAKAGDKKIYVKVSAKWTYKDYTGFIKLAMPAEYLTKASTYGTQEAYYFEVGSLYVDVKESVNYYATCSELIIQGSVTRKYIDSYLVESDGSLTPIKVLDYIGIGKGKVYFTVTTLKDIHVDKDYAAGDDVNDFIRFQASEYRGKLYYSDDNPFYNKQVADSPYYQNPEEHLYKIRTAKAISKDADGVSSAHTFELYIELNEFIALSPSTSKFELRIKANGYFERIYPETVCKFNIAAEGELPTDDTETGSDGDDSEDPGIIYGCSQDIIIYAVDENKTKVNSTYINMTTETLVTDLSYSCYSTDGGTKWKAVSSALTNTQFSKLMNKGMTFCIADKYDKKSKKPAEDATIYSFSTINKRPATPKLKIDYSTYSDPTGVTAGQWILMDGATMTALDSDALDKLEIGLAGSNKKTVDDNGYGDFPVNRGISVKKINGTKVESVIYFVRVKATANTPASKAVKLNVKGQQKAGKVKVDYKKEILKVKKGSIVYFGDTLNSGAEELKDQAKTYSDFSGKYIIVTDEIAKSGIDISAYITDTRNTIKIWTNATSKKAASAVQTIQLARRNEIKEGKITVSGGKIKLDKKYEVYNEATGKWGSVPKVTESCELKIRLKATAKGGSESDSTYAASDAAILKITYGVIDAAKNKSGITAAEIVLSLGEAQNDSI